MHLISIIIPAYNMDNYIHRAIQSVLNQSYKHWELIVVNDGSTDNTQNVVERFVALDKRISLINQDNSGVSVARNRGIAAAEGAYISFLDADDYYDKEYLEKMSAPLKANQADMTFCKFKEVKGDPSHPQTLEVLTQTPADVNEIFNDCFTDHIEYIPYAKANMAIMYNLTKLREEGIEFYPGGKFAEDTEFVLKAAFTFRIHYVPEYLYFYLYRQNSASRGDFNNDKYLQEIAAYTRALEFAQQHQSTGLAPDIYFAYMNKLLFTTKNRARRYLWYIIGQGDYQAATDFLNQYEQQYHQPFTVPFTGFKRLSNWFKLAIIRSKNRYLWKLFVPKSSKKYD